MAYNEMGIDKDIMTSNEETQRLNFVENLLRHEYDQSVFRVLNVVNQLDRLQRESSFVRQYIVVPELHKSLESIIAKL
jgi:hypothetical protein